MRRRARNLAIAGAAAIAVATVAVVPTVCGRPWSIDHFFTRVFVELLLRHPMLLTQLRVLEPFGLRAHNRKLDDFSVAAARAEAAAVRENLAMLRSYPRDAQSESQRFSADVLDWFLSVLADPEARHAHARPSRGDPGPSPADRDRAGAAAPAGVPARGAVHRLRGRLGALCRAARTRARLPPDAMGPHRGARRGAVSRGAARGRHGHPCRTLEPRAGDRVHAREHRHARDRRRRRGRALRGDARPGVRVQDRTARDPRAARAQDALGARFDLRALHDVVLGSGALPLELLERVVGDWIESQRAALH